MKRTSYVRFKSPYGKPTFASWLNFWLSFIVHDL